MCLASCLLPLPQLSSFEFSDMIACPLLYPVTVIIGFQQSHYKVNEGDGCVRVCAEVVAGRLKGNSSVSFNFRTSPNTAIRKFVRYLLC